MTDRAELKPCPFCGKAMMLRGALWPSDGDTDAIIHSEPTDCPMYDFCDGTADGSIVERWNRRPADAPAPAGTTTGCYLSDLDHYLSQARNGETDVRVSVQRLREWREAFNALYYGPRPSWAPKHDAPAPAAPPERIRVAQDATGFWTCREAISGSPEYIRADLAPAPAAGDPTKREG